MRALILTTCLITLAAVAWSGGARADDERPSPTKPLVGFDDLPTGPYRDGFIDSWRWTKEFRAEARLLSRVEIVDMPGEKGGALRIRVDDSRVLAGPPLPLYRVLPYLQPHSMLQARVRVVSGEVGLYVGGPTAYYGNSDVYSEPQKLRAADPPEWIHVTFNLNHPTWRNFRRAGFSADAPRNYYLRWAQEPLGIYLTPESKGEILIDRFDAVTMGEGRYFHGDEYPTEVKHLRTIADFEPETTAVNTDAELAFNLFMAADETDWFEESWKRTKPLRFSPLKLNVVAEGFQGKHSLACIGRTAEEVQCTGIRTTGEPGANALYVELKSTARSDRGTLDGFGPALPVDFLVFVAPPGKPFDWARFGPSAELREHAGPGFDYQFSHRSLRDVKDADFAIYQTRRFVKPGAWTKLALHLTDFTCIYGHGAFRRKLLEQEPLTSDGVVAVAWLRPWCRSGRSEDDDTTTIDELSFVATNWERGDMGRYWWQVPDLKSLIVREGTMAGQKTLHLALPEDLDPPLMPARRRLR